MEIMLDIETLSKAGDAAVVQIGMVPFELEGTGIAHEGVCLNIDPDASMAAGLRVDWDTLHWWMSERAAFETLAPPGTGMLLSEALKEVVSYFRNWGNRVWANGAVFDVGIIENAMRRCRIEPPWQYNRVMCMRPLRTLCGDAADLKVKPVTAHNALSDAVAQALWTQNMWRAIKRLAPEPVYEDLSVDAQTLRVALGGIYKQLGVTNVTEVMMKLRELTAVGAPAREEERPEPPAAASETVAWEPGKGDPKIFDDAEGRN